MGFPTGKFTRFLCRVVLSGHGQLRLAAKCTLDLILNFPLIRNLENISYSYTLFESEKQFMHEFFFRFLRIEVQALMLWLLMQFVHSFTLLNMKIPGLFSLCVLSKSTLFSVEPSTCDLYFYLIFLLINQNIISKKQMVFMFFVNLCFWFFFGAMFPI